MNIVKRINLPIIAAFFLFIVAIALTISISNPVYATPAATTSTYSSTVVWNGYTWQTLKTPIISEIADSDFQLSFFLPMLMGVFFLSEVIVEFFMNKEGKALPYHIVSIVLSIGTLLFMILWFAHAYGLREGSFSEEGKTLRSLAFVSLLLLAFASLAYKVLLIKGEKFVKDHLSVGSYSLSFGLSSLSLGFTLMGVLKDNDESPTNSIGIASFILVVFAFLAMVYGLLYLFAPGLDFLRKQKVYLSASIAIGLMAFALAIVAVSIDFAVAKDEPLTYFVSTAIATFIMALATNLMVVIPDQLSKREDA